MTTCIKYWALACILVLFCLKAGNASAFEIKKHTEPNGLMVVQVERHSLPLVMATLLIKASPLDEQPGKAGVADLTSKMLTEGTTQKSSTEINEDIEFMGASLSASTNYDYSAISLSVLRKDADKGFDLFSDVATHAAFRDDDLKRKKGIILGALKQKEEEPDFVANRAFIKEVFGKQPYGRLVEGDAESVEGLQRDDVVNFYKEHYVPSNAILLVVGDLTAEELEKLVRKYFSSWQGTAIQRPILSDEGAAASLSKGVKRVVIDRDISQANIIIGHKGISRGNHDYYAVTVMNYILGGGGFASRLMKVIRDEMGLTYGIYSFFAANKEPGQFEVSVKTKNESAETVIQETLKQIRIIQSEPVSDQELADAKAYLTGSFPRKLETSRLIADFLAAVQFYNLGDNYISKYPDYINSVTKEDVLRVAKKYLDPENYSLVIVGKQKER
jgi:zinc protease